MSLSVPSSVESENHSINAFLSKPNFGGAGVSSSTSVSTTSSWVTCKSLAKSGSSLKSFCMFPSISDIQLLI